MNDIATTLKLSNNFSPFIFRSPLLTLTADASLNPTLKISLEKLPLNVKYLKLELEHCDYKNETEIHEVNDPCSDDYIPTMSCLLRWQSELQNTSVAIEIFYCEFWLARKQCRYNLEAIPIAQKLHKAREIKEAVEKELTYLFSPRMKPLSTTKEIDYNALEKFIELIHNTPYLSKLSSFDMLPEELACLCGRRYLSNKHMSWVIQKLSPM